MIRTLDQIVDLARTRGKKRLVVAQAEDPHTLEAVNHAIDLGIVDVILIGNRQAIQSVATSCHIDLNKFIIQEEATDVQSVARAVSLVKSGEADILMKGLVSTDKYIKGILDKDNGLLLPKSILGHVSIIEIPTYHKLLIVSDVAVTPVPTQKQKVQLVYYVSDVGHTLGIELPKVALIAPSEQVLPNIISCYDAAIISKMWQRGQIQGCILDGPLALDVAIDKNAVRIKKLISPVEGDADCLVFPNLETANVFFKTCTNLMNARIAAMVMGASAPCVLTSRSDSEQSKLFSIALASISVK